MSGGDAGGGTTRVQAGQGPAKGAEDTEAGQRVLQELVDHFGKTRRQVHKAQRLAKTE
jgi:DNA-binding PadR family transcriptional regulator